MILKEPSWMDWIEPDGIHLNTKGHHWVFERLINWQSLVEWSGIK